MNYKEFCRIYGLPYDDPRSIECYRLWLKSLPVYTTKELAHKGRPFVIFDGGDPDHWFILISFGLFFFAIFKYLM